MSSYILLTIACENKATTTLLAQQLVEMRLIACAQLLPVQSIYRWKGKIEQAEEVLLQAKTLHSKLTEIEIFVKENHSYDVPEIIATPIIWGHQAYLDWLEENVEK